MYMVKQVAALTGVPEATLRVWERRYGVVSPQRSDGGYRLYDEAQLQTLRQMAALVSGGVPASKAAQTVLASAGAPTPGTLAHEMSEDSLVEAAESLDTGRLTDVVDSALALGPFDQVAQEWLQPQLERLGLAWESGRISVAQEHFASAGLVRALASLFNRVPHDSSGPTVLIGLPSGDRHSLVLLAFAICMRSRGANVIYLGADVPLSSWVQAAEHARPRAAVIGVTADKLVGEAQRVIDALLQVTPPVSVWAGGSRQDKVCGVTLLPHEVANAADALALALSGGLA